MLLFFFAAPPSYAQQGFYIPRQGKVFFAGDTATIFSNVINEGNLGIEKKAILNFKGQVWSNTPTSLLTDGGNAPTGAAGWIRFMADSLRQRISGGYNAATKTGPVFSNLQIQNPLGIELTGSGIKVWQEVNFKLGRFYLNGQNFVAGHNGPGRITGYDSSRFFVTASQPNGGLLIRENISATHGLVTFPVGTSENAYTPAAIQSKAFRGDDYLVSVFDGVKSNLFSGNSLADESVNKTWQIGKRFFPGQDEVEVFLQHLEATEGSAFAANRSKSYISQYSNNNWDVAGMQLPPAIGYLTTGQSMTNSSVHNRMLTSTLSSSSYFTKLAGNRNSTLKTNLLLMAYRVGAFFNNVMWQTKPEINIKKFVVERRRANEPAFTSIDTVASLAPNGFSTGYLNYSINDSNSYKGISFYRLKIFEYNDSTYYSPIVGVSGIAFDDVKLWPNPATDQFSVILAGHVAKEIVIYNLLGQALWKEDVAGRSVIEIKGLHLIPGIYIVAAYNKDGRPILREKLLIRN